MILGTAFEDALLYACHVHGGQTRKGGDVPYLGHLLGVAALVLEDGGDEDEAIAALLHDAAEDQGGEPRLEDIRARFGRRVAMIVKECTDTMETPKPPWRKRKEEYIEHLRAGRDLFGLRVSLADKLYNARAILLDLRVQGEALWERFDADADQLWYYRSLAEVYKEKQPGPMAQELARVVDAIEQQAGSGAATSAGPTTGDVPTRAGSPWWKPLGRLLPSRMTRSSARDSR